MKKTVLTFGLISGGISALLMLCTIPFADKIGFDRGVYVGYTAMVLSFLMIFFGVRSYRENVGGGEITFVKAFYIGILITLISCACYVITWEITYFFFMPDFIDKYSAYVIEKQRAAGGSQQAIDASLQQMKSFKAMYDNPLYNSAITFTEPFPVGLIISIISAFILRKKKGGNNISVPATA
ncbi:MAG TPA: DUF4199 domain-containing protein [Pyrinomonadaceae bacterium]|nr:DUF4199 domain-containing protein [Pyrinomonadaceae bacterium]